ncbi:hypothetical protein KC19_VG193600 [Ceratodon purpureus]|uniref:Secreted protein n=1 Tax=Ceratodon purpureus TaxID=3225 RepID=A0A8T0HRM4_CERPU|nr:hypothetical protein KC19_VG193600 [Ceratodon purpureus]
MHPVTSMQCLLCSFFQSHVCTGLTLCRVFRIESVMFEKFRFRASIRASEGGSTWTASARMSAARRWAQLSASREKEVDDLRAMAGE